VRSARRNGVPLRRLRWNLSGFPKPARSDTELGSSECNHFRTAACR
jgi:hypothetical protein